VNSCGALVNTKLWILQSAINTGCFKTSFNGIPNDTVRRLLRKRLHLKAYKLSIVQGVKRGIVCTLLSVNVFITIATWYHLEYYCNTMHYQ
jgi:hypothetical protein